jgi:hypothetical protein
MDMTFKQGILEQCICERALFADDCNCGFEEEEELRHATKWLQVENKRKKFLAEYPSIIFQSYKDYKQSNGRLGFVLGPPPTRSERNLLIVDELMEFW